MAAELEGASSMNERTDFRPLPGLPPSGASEEQTRRMREYVGELEGTVAKLRARVLVLEREVAELRMSVSPDVTNADGSAKGGRG